ncbi:MAG: hypothetical protein KA715_04480 [Xanthomonadaceae bacterium]|nr:hypothetical protein [Xanthomonadaceae bacterium]
MEKVNRSQESGQASVEYIVLLAMVVLMFISLQAGLKSFKLGDKIKTVLFEKFSNAYRYGHPSARANVDGTGGYDRQARFSNNPTGNDSQNFRIFVNPSKR